MRLCFVNLVMMGLMTDQRGAPDLLERVEAGGRDEDLEGTFEAIYRRRYRDVFRYALMMLRHEAEAEDVTAEAFDRAYSAWRSGHGPAGQSLPWLLLITRRIVIDKQRRRRLISWLPIAALHPHDEPSAAAETDRTDFWLWFGQFARQLPARQREVLILRYQRDLDDESIGEILGLSASGVRSLVARACETLRRNPEIWR
jgi:RNA polymerase sigma-70 factor (ECF subfamily)